MKFNREKIQSLYKKIFIILILFSFILVFLYIIVGSYFFSNKFKEISLDNAFTQIVKKEKYLNDFINKSSQELRSIQESMAFKEFNQKNNLDLLEELFLFTAKNDKNIMQVRYIDKTGLEKIRVDRKSLKSPFITTIKKDFQNKSHRDYFYKSKDKAANKVWFTKLDLNYENNKIEIPYKATLRAVLPLEKNKSFNGIIIINYYMNDFLDAFMNNNLYDSILIDKEAYTLLHYDKDKSWGRYKTPHIKLNNLDLKYTKDIFLQDILKTDNFVSKKLNTKIENELTLILKLNEQYLEEEKNNQYTTKISISFIIFILSIFFIIVISKILEKIILNLSSYEEYVNLIDENIITSTTDLEGKIVFASKAFCKISGYEEKELLGKSHNIVRHPDEDINKYKELWNNLNNNQIWQGEFKNKSKLGEDYWVDAKIYPIYDDKKNKIGYTAIRHDITAKKLVQKLAITDGLTDVFNRKHFDFTMPKIINAARRNNEIISFAMIDIDNFKNYNDTYGHHQGDIALESVAKVLKLSMNRSNDYVFRLGGEEFALVFISKSLESSIKFSKKICKKVEELKIEHSKNDASEFLTISIGLLCKKAENIENYIKFYENADELLYQSKENGRNKVTSNKEV